MGDPATKAESIGALDLREGPGVVWIEGGWPEVIGVTLDLIQAANPRMLRFSQPGRMVIEVANGRALYAVEEWEQKGRYLRCRLLRSEPLKNFGLMNALEVALSDELTQNTQETNGES